MTDQLDLLDPPTGDWWECSSGSSKVFVRAPTVTEARDKAEEHLRDLGVISGGAYGLHENFERMRAFARRDR